MTDAETLKRQAAERALAYVASGMRLGLGTGSTATAMLYALAERIADGRLSNIVGVPTSERTAELSRRLGIPLATLAEQPELDLAIDGADEVTPELHLIKGLGGAMLREKIVVASARRFVVVADTSKRVGRLCERAPVPVEVVAFGRPLCERRVAQLGGRPALRLRPDGQPFVTDEGNLILDCRFEPIGDPAALSAALDAIPGVVGHGLFVGMASVAVLAGPDGVTVLE
ncbi:MAG: hypothetical protein RLZZ387_4757 [Chloroflexota bacterium]